MRLRFALVLSVGLLAAGLAIAETPKFDRTIGHEPVYKTKAPKYGLLVFGSEGKDRVWLVHDGDTLYVDRNGNGNLTEAGKKVAAEKKPGRDSDDAGYSFEVGELTVGGRTHKGLGVQFVRLKQFDDNSIAGRPDVKAALAKDPMALAVFIHADVQVPGVKGGGLEGRLSYSVGPIDLTGVFQFADTPAEAPIVHLGGPLQITFCAERPTFCVGRETELALVVGTPGTGPGSFAMLGYQDTIPEEAKPVAELALHSAQPGGPPIKEKITIKSRC